MVLNRPTIRSMFAYPLTLCDGDLEFVCVTMLVFQKATKSIEDKLKSSRLAINVHHSECNKNVKEQRLDSYSFIML